MSFFRTFPSAQKPGSAPLLPTQARLFVDRSVLPGPFLSIFPIKTTSPPPLPFFFFDICRQNFFFFQHFADPTPNQATTKMLKCLVCTFWPLFIGSVCRTFQLHWDLHHVNVRNFHPPCVLGCPPPPSFDPQNSKIDATFFFPPLCPSNLLY